MFGKVGEEEPGPQRHPQEGLPHHRGNRIPHVQLVVHDAHQVHEAHVGLKGNRFLRGPKVVAPIHRLRPRGVCRSPPDRQPKHRGIRTGQSEPLRQLPAQPDHLAPRRDDERANDLASRHLDLHRVGRKVAEHQHLGEIRKPLLGHDSFRTVGRSALLWLGREHGNFLVAHAGEPRVVRIERKARSASLPLASGDHCCPRLAPLVGAASKEAVVALCRVLVVLAGVVSGRRSPNETKVVLFVPVHDGGGSQRTLLRRHDRILPDHLQERLSLVLGTADEAVLRICQGQQGSPYDGCRLVLPVALLQRAELVLDERPDILRGLRHRQGDPQRAEVAKESLSHRLRPGYLLGRIALQLLDDLEEQLEHREEGPDRLPAGRVPAELEETGEHLSGDCIQQPRLFHRHLACQGQGHARPAESRRTSEGRAADDPGVAERAENGAFLPPEHALTVPADPRRAQHPAGERAKSEISLASSGGSPKRLQINITPTVVPRFTSTWYAKLRGVLTHADGEPGAEWVFPRVRIVTCARALGSSSPCWLCQWHTRSFGLSSHALHSGQMKPERRRGLVGPSTAAMVAFEGSQAGPCARKRSCFEAMLAPPSATASAPAQQWSRDARAPLGSGWHWLGASSGRAECSRKDGRH
eukprot:scaffold7891_cov277-Pinguiococcus_pyrenoidosus.AAC.2